MLTIYLDKTVGNAKARKYLSRKYMRCEQKKDEHFAIIRKWLQNGFRPECHEIARYGEPVGGFLF